MGCGEAERFMVDKEQEGMQSTSVLECVLGSVLKCTAKRVSGGLNQRRLEVAGLNSYRQLTT